MEPQFLHPLGLQPGIGPGQGQAAAGGQIHRPLGKERVGQQIGAPVGAHAEPQQPGRRLRIRIRGDAGGPGIGWRRENWLGLAAPRQQRGQLPGAAAAHAHAACSGFGTLARSAEAFVQNRHLGLKVRGADTGQTHHQQRRRLLAGRGRQGRAPEIEPLGRDPGAQQGGAPGHQGCHRAAQQQAPPLGWQGQGAQGDLGDQAEAAPAAAQQPHQVVAGHVLHHLAAGHRLNPVGPQQAQANQLIPHAQVALAIAPGQAPGHQAANAPMALAWGCGLA